MIQAADKIASPKEYKKIIGDIKNGYTEMADIVAKPWTDTTFKEIEKKDAVFSPMIKTLRVLAKESLTIAMGGKAMNSFEVQTTFFKFVADKTDIAFPLASKVAELYHRIEKDFKENEGQLSENGMTLLGKLRPMVRGIAGAFTYMDGMARDVD